MYVTKRVRFATFALSIVDNFCLLQQYKLSKIEIRLPRLSAIRINSGLFLTFSSAAEKERE